MVNTDQLTDYQLVERYAQGDAKCAEILIRRHRSRVYTYILMLVKNRDLAEDIFQDTFLKVVKSLREGAYKDDGRFVGWVLRIAHNLVIDHFRRQKNLRTVPQGDDGDFAALYKHMDLAADDPLAAEQRRRKVRGLMAKLPAEQKEVVVMRLYMGMSFKEIAAVTDVSINTSLGRMRYALINMRKMMAKTPKLN